MKKLFLFITLVVGMFGAKLPNMGYTSEEILEIPESIESGYDNMGTFADDLAEMLNIEEIAKSLKPMYDAIDVHNQASKKSLIAIKNEGLKLITDSKVSESAKAMLTKQYIDGIQYDIDVTTRAMYAVLIGEIILTLCPNMEDYEIKTCMYNMLPTITSGEIAEEFKKEIKIAMDELLAEYKDTMKDLKKSIRQLENMR